MQIKSFDKYYTPELRSILQYCEIPNPSKIILVWGYRSVKFIAKYKIVELWNSRVNEQIYFLLATSFFRYLPLLQHRPKKFTFPICLISFCNFLQLFIKGWYGVKKYFVSLSHWESRVFRNTYISFVFALQEKIKTKNQACLWSDIWYLRKSLFYGVNWL